MDISIIIPVYNEDKSISEILDKLIDLKLDNLKKELIAVDDGSTDETPDILKRFEKKPGFKLITHKKNSGKGMAIRTGINNSSGSIIVLQDSDMEYDPKEIPKLIKPILEGEQVVYGSRFLGSIEDMKFLFYLGNRILTLFTSLLFQARITDMETGYKIFRREVIDDMKLESRGFEIEPELTAKILKKGYEIIELPISYRARENNQKKITVRDGIISLFTLIKYRFQ